MIVVTGASGFLGRHLVPLLAERLPNQRIRLFDLEPNSLHRDFEFVRGSIEDPLAVAASVKDADVIINLAAKVQPSSIDAEGLFRANVDGASNVYSAAAVAGCKLFFHMSSSGIYGHPRTELPFRETDTPWPVTAYQRSKWQADLRLQSLDSRGMTLNMLRPSGIYGSGSVLEVPTYRRILKRRWSLELAGGMIVHPTHVSDVARAIIAIVERPAPHRTVFNIGGERPLPLSELHMRLAAALGVTRHTVVVPRSMAPIAWAAMRLLSLAGRPKAELTSMVRGHWFSSAVDDTLFRQSYPDVGVMSLEEGLREHVQWARAQGLL